MQWKKLARIALAIVLIILVGINVFFFLNRVSYKVTYTEEITYSPNNTLSNFETEQNNFKKFVYTRNDNLTEIAFSDFESRFVSSSTSLETSEEVGIERIFDKSFINTKTDLTDYENRSIILPLKYSKYFDYKIYGSSEPELQLEWNFSKLKDFDHFYIDVAGYTNELFILPGPISKLELIENTIGYLKENGIEPEQISLIVDVRVYVWPNRYFESNIIQNYTDTERQAEVLNQDEYASKYSSIDIFKGTTISIDPSYNESHISLSLKMDLSDIIELAKRLGLQGYTIQDGRTI